MPNLQRTEARRDLAQFVRDRRERTRPQDVGLDPGERRRTPGLRREEVAQLVGVSLTWYTWFEQGRDIQVSARFLNRVSEAFRLDDGGRALLFDLAQHSPPTDHVPVPNVPARDWEHPSPGSTGVPSRAVTVPSRPDPEAHRINQSIRRIIAGEEVRTPPPAAVPAGGPRRGVRWSIGMTVLGLLMLMPVTAVS